MLSYRLRHLAASASSLSVCALLCACAAPERPTRTFWDAGSTSALTQQQQAVRKEAELIGKRYLAACVSPRHRAYFRKTACLPNGITAEMLADRTKITKEQKTAAEAVFKIADSLSEEMRAVMIRTGVPRYIELAEDSRLKTDPVVKMLQSDLLESRITWGEYNTRRLALGEEAAREASQLGRTGRSAMRDAGSAEEPEDNSLAADEIDAPEEGDAE